MGNGYKGESVIHLSAVAKLLDVHQRTVERWQAKGVFPESVRVNGKGLGGPYESDFATWQADSRTPWQAGDGKKKGG